MTRTASGLDASVADWLEAEGIVPSDGAGAIADVDRIYGLLAAAAHEGRAVSYSELLGQLGFRFSRPKMRAVCKTLDAVDARARAIGSPDLAVLVVRESDRLPGQGWWVGVADRDGYRGSWEGAEAAAFIAAAQAKVFAFWAKRRVV